MKFRRLKLWKPTVHTLVEREREVDIELTGYGSQRSCRSSRATLSSRTSRCGGLKKTTSIPKLGFGMDRI